MTARKMTIEDLFGLNDQQKAEFQIFYHSPRAKVGRCVTRNSLKNGITLPEMTKAVGISLESILLIQAGNEDASLTDCRRIVDWLNLARLPYLCNDTGTEVKKIVYSDLP